MPPSQDLYKQLTDYDATRKNSVDVLNEALGKYGVPEIRNRVSGLRTTLSNTENALNAVDPSVTGRTQGSLVTEAQRSKQVANERAPIAEQYGQYSRSLGDAQNNLSDQERAAQLLAQNQQTDWQTGRQSIADRYNLATAAEAEARRRAEADRAYQLEREKIAEARRASSGGLSGLGGLFGGSGGGQTGGAKMVQRGDKGFNFLDAGGNPISAAQYAALKGTDFRSVLQSMADAGDAGARAALGFVGNDFGYDPNKLKDRNAANIYNSLVWGTGRSAASPSGGGGGGGGW